MEIPADKMSLFLSKVNTICTHKVCPMCGKKNWTVEGRLFELREFNSGDLIIGGGNSAIIPIIPITCTNCGNIQFMNALINGVIDSTPTTSPNPNSPNDGTR